MSDHSKIEWLEGAATWNFIIAVNKRTKKPGWFCMKVSEGCRHCYAETMNKWRGNRFAYGAQNLPRLKIQLNRKVLQQPLHWPKPRRIFPCSMTDLFGSWVPTSMIDAGFKVMEECPQHTFIIVTKRPARMRDYLYWRYRGHLAPKHLFFLVSVEDQKRADERIPILLCIRSFMSVAVLGVSYEPALGPIVWNPDWFTWPPKRSHSFGDLKNFKPGIDWILVGGESGPRARPSHPRWFQTARDQCQAADINFFFKQWGEWIGMPITNKTWARLTESHLYGWRDPVIDHGQTNAMSYRVGKKRAGRLLDGREWNEFPESAD